MRVRDTGFSECMVCDAIDCRGEDNIRSSISLLVCIDHAQIDATMESGGRNGLDLFDILVAVDCA